MNRIKDFFYNKNDIIVALIIILAAAFVIYDRVETIMAYPETQAAQVQQEDIETVTDIEDDNSGY